MTKIASSTTGVTKRKPRRWPSRRLERVLDEIKDSVDRLRDIPNIKQRDEAAKNLLDYLELHIHS